MFTSAQLSITSQDSNGLEGAWPKLFDTPPIPESVVLYVQYLGECHARRTVLLVRTMKICSAYGYKHYLLLTVCLH